MWTPETTPTGSIAERPSERVVVRSSERHGTGSPARRSKEGVEQTAYDAVVHPWDRERYLERG